MAYADYEYYKDIYLGTAISEQDFPRLSLRASSFWITTRRVGRLKTRNWMP